MRTWTYRYGIGAEQWLEPRDGRLETPGDGDRFVRYLTAVDMAYVAFMAGLAASLALQWLTGAETLQRLADWLIL